LGWRGGEVSLEMMLHEGAARSRTEDDGRPEYRRRTAMDRSGRRLVVTRSSGGAGVLRRWLVVAVHGGVLRG
jgi:hypothetical protein